MTVEKLGCLRLPFPLDSSQKLLFLPVSVDLAGNLLGYFSICWCAHCLYPTPVRNRTSGWYQVHQVHVIGARSDEPWILPFEEIQSRAYAEMHIRFPKLCKDTLFIGSSRFPGSSLKKEKQR